MSIKKVLLAIVSVVGIACQSDNGYNYNHQGKYDTEKVVIEKYLNTYTYDVDKDELVVAENGATTLANDPKLIPLSITFNDVDYTMYSYISEEGVGLQPDDNDVINAAYRVHTLTEDANGNLVESDAIDENYVSDSFFDLSSNSLYRGWRLGFQEFKGGTVVEIDPTEPRQYKDTGKGFMIMSSGLTHSVEGNPVNEFNTILIFKVELRNVKKNANTEED
ncbi:hypothetical protein [Ochrovirga pacifica]|uniref:hypothetical protein n=1 Tax=Ochrovirga pacifica TaxID=1042376 RepID=UPI000255A4C8|nr:hypothetical protein [Ochrovirga pacifica]